MKFKILLGIVFIFFLSVWFYNFQVQSDEKSLFPREEIVHSKIEQIQVLNIKSNATKVIDNKDSIKAFSSRLRDLNSDQFDIDLNEEEPIYLIYIINNGRNSNPAIAVSKDSIVYRGKQRSMTFEESSSFLKFIAEIHK